MMMMILRQLGCFLLGSVSLLLLSLLKSLHPTHNASVDDAVLGTSSSKNAV